MRTMRLVLLSLTAILLALPAFAADPPTDFQLRGALHFFGSGKPIGGWMVFPDLTAPRPRTLVVFGPAVRDAAQNPQKPAKRWIEFLGGAFLEADGSTDPVLNVRMATPFAGLNLYADGLYDSANKRGVGLFQAVMPLRHTAFQAGSEVEVVVQQQRPVTIGLGPRLVKPLGPGSISMAYQFRNRGPDVLRFYAVVNF